MKAQRGVQVQLYSLTSVLDGTGGQHHAPAFYVENARERDAVPIVKHAGWTPEPVWTDEGNFARPPPPSGFHPWTVQSVASHYTDYPIIAFL